MYIITHRLFIRKFNHVVIEMYFLPETYKQIQIKKQMIHMNSTTNCASAIFLQLQNNMYSSLPSYHTRPLNSSNFMSYTDIAASCDSTYLDYTTCICIWQAMFFNV